MGRPTKAQAAERIKAAEERDAAILAADSRQKKAADKKRRKPAAASEEPVTAHTGRPPKFRSPAELDRAINEFFEACDGELVTDADGHAITDKAGRPIYVRKRPPTEPGLCLWLGFANKRSLQDYADKADGFRDVVERAMLRIESYAAEMLYERDAEKGAEYYLIAYHGKAARKSGEAPFGAKNGGGGVIVLPERKSPEIGGNAAKTEGATDGTE